MLNPSPNEFGENNAITKSNETILIRLKIKNRIPVFCNSQFIIESGCADNNLSVPSSFSFDKILTRIKKIGLEANIKINYTTLGSPLKDFRQYLDREVRIQRNQIIGHSIRIDNYGNIITNISKSDFYNVLSKNNGNFEINLGVDKILNISESYNDVGIADLFALFNYNDNLEIGMNKGNASNLLGIKNHTPITINFL